MPVRLYLLQARRQKSCSGNEIAEPNAPANAGSPSCAVLGVFGPAWLRSPLDMKVCVVPPDPSWPAEFKAEAARIRRAVGDIAVAVHHIGSTSIPGIVA